jgi:predicted nucleic acid-binding protein
MSCADSEVITLAIRKKADYILADDRIVRDVASVEGIRPMGTLGIILKAYSKKLLSLEKAQDSFYALVRQHNFRISIKVYDAFKEKLRTLE